MKGGRPDPGDRLRSLTDRDERDLDEEMALHIDLEAADLERRGWSPEDARREARRRFGGVERHKAAIREDARGRVLDDLGRDLRIAVRRLARAPGFALTVLLAATAALAAFALVGSFGVSALLRPYPYPDADRIAYVTALLEEEGIERWRFSGPELLRLEEAVGDAPFGAFWGGSSNLEGDGLPERIRSLRVTPGFFDVLGVEPLAGRVFRPGDRARDRRLVVVGAGLWERRWSSDPSLIGRTITVDGAGYEVVGVMPERVRIIGSEMWLHQPVDFAGDDPERFYLYGLVRRPGKVSPGALLGALRTVDDELVRSRARAEGASRPWTMSTVPLTFALERVRPSVRVLAAAAGLVWAVTCLNVWVLMLLRSLARSGEVALRRACGAGRVRLVLPVALEQGLLLGTSTVAALAAAGWAVSRLHLLLPRRPGGLEYIPFEARFALDPLVVAATVLLAAVLLAVSLAPAVHAARTADLSRAGRSAGRATGRSGLRRALVAGEVALTAALAVGAVVLLRGYLELRSVEPGFRVADVTTATVTLPSARYADGDARRRRFREIVAALEAVPGVRSAAATSLVPLEGFQDQEDVVLPDDGGRPRLVATRRVTPGFFATLDVPILSGRPFAGADDAAGEPVAVVNATLAGRLGGPDRAVGRTLRIAAEERPRTVVGVAGDVRDIALEGPVEPTVWVPAGQTEPAPGRASLLVHAPGAGPELGRRMREAVAELDPALPLWDVRSLASWVEGAVGTHRLALALLGGFSVLTLALTGLGIYAVMSFDVRSQLRELGIRSALGAGSVGLAGLIVTRALGVLVPGTAAGMGLALLASSLLPRFFAGVERPGWIPFLAGGAVLALAALAATLPSALLAARLSPARVLRAE